MKKWSYIICSVAAPPDRGRLLTYGNAAWQQSFRNRKSFKLKKAEKNKNEDVFGKGQ